MSKDKMLTPSFCYILAANFLLFFAFYLILPILAFYLQEEFSAGKTMIGFIGYIVSTSALLGGLFYFHSHFRWIYPGYESDAFHCLAYYTWSLVRDGNSGW